MIPELGHFAMLAAFAVAVIQFVVPFAGTWKREPRWMAVGASAAQAQFALILIAYACLTWAFVERDWSVAYVAANAHSQLPLMYRISAVWGAHEGSMLLWMLMLTGWGAAVSVFSRSLPRDVQAQVLAVLGALCIGFLLFMLLTSNPFERHFPVPEDGRDLNPLLQDPGLVVHPPLLYMGYVGFSVAFAFAIAALIGGRMDAAWARWTRPWTTSAWLFLTLGITLGSWWAYHELGWGGWWFWDPVENASFLPWLVGTALIHSLAVSEKRGLLKSWTVLLAILAFALSLLGTFLVRSGILVSVHAFATDPARGVFILAFLGIVLGIAFSLYAWRAHRFVADGEFALLSREGLLLLNNVFLVIAAAAVLIGTLYPLIVDALGLGKISVGPPYFNAVFLPLTAPLAVLIGLASVIGWKRAGRSEVLRRLRWPAVLAVVGGLALPWLVEQKLLLVAAAGGMLALWAMLMALEEPWRRWRARGAAGLTQMPRGIWGMTLAHFGIGLWVLGVTFVSLYSIERDVRLGPGQSTDLADYRFELLRVEPFSGPNYDADRAVVEITRDGRHIAELYPEKRLYRAQGSVMTDAAVEHSPLRDLYVALAEPLDNGEWAMRVYVKPMMRLVWLGGVLMALGGVLAASDRRYRLARMLRESATVPGGATA
ncbi:MAG: heme lyase CcmF/NrfE family subunit [Sinimarinibacterium flocculans]|uniref:Cytochrome c-type biogenesis protein CcmF n=1 Tax=Sinimarinibacterium flocculans TaxID=985250 RepID=A0A318E9F7_9GAMM|nr:heme lyase CcmF/NrfE family subunit [Sinimarinibacterium flocculans]MEC9365084.1 heme lyase CcmF/NrfE family subunit [Pseudomonadota bacterium]PXV68555.1 cytochrome c-type biogenesis protein CcmF [Sinimarinibacterium flocculans]